MKVYFILGGIITILFIIVLVLMKLLFSKKHQIVKKSTHHINIEKIKDIAQLATIECFVQSVVDLRDEKRRMRIFGTAKKKSLLVARGRVHVGFDLTKCRISEDREKPRILLPAPQILSCDVEEQITYDERASIWNPITSEDRDALHKEAREELRKSAATDDVFFRARKNVRAVLGVFFESQGLSPIVEFSDQKTIVEKEIKKLPEEKHVENIREDRLKI